MFPTPHSHIYIYMNTFICIFIHIDANMDIIGKLLAWGQKPVSPKKNPLYI